MKVTLFTYSDALRNKISRFAVSMLGNEEEAKDVVQEVFEKLWEKRFIFAKYENKEALSFKLARDLCYDRIKHLKTKSEKLQILARDEITDDLRYKTEEKDLGETAKKIIATLPEKQRLVIHLRDIEEMEFEEISGILDMDINAIRMNLSRARMTIREQLLKTINYGIR